MTFPLTLTHPGQPLPAPRPRVGRFGTYNDPAYSAYKTDLGWAMKKAVGRCHVPDRGPWEVTLMFYRNRRNDADGDNCEKTILDALTGIIWVNDRYVKKCCWEMRYDKANPRVELTITRK